MENSHYLGVVIWGEGGVGKTTLARSVYQEIEKKFDLSIITILTEKEERISSTLQEELISAFLTTSVTDPDFQRLQQRIKRNGKSKSRLEMIINFLSGEFKNEKKLLIIDNVIAVGREKQLNLSILKQLLRIPNIKFLITSREPIEISSFFHLHLKPLPPFDAMKLFFNNYEGSILDENEKRQKVKRLIRKRETIKEIVQLINYNPLIISYFAKLLAKTESLTPEELVEKIKNSKTAFLKIKNANKGAYTPLQYFYNQLFDIGWKYLDEKKRVVLKKIALLPSNYPLNGDILKEYFIKDIEINKELQQGIISELGNSGWLQKIEKENWKLHPIVKEYILYSVKITLADIFPQIEWGVEIMENVEKVKNALSIKERGYIPFLEAIAKAVLILFPLFKNYTFSRVKKEKKRVRKFFPQFWIFWKKEDKSNKQKNVTEEEWLKIRKLFHQIGVLFYHLGNYDKAENYLEKALKIEKEFLKESSLDSAMTYNQLGVVYESQGKYEKAEECHLKALKIKQKILGKNHSSIATTYSNIAGVFYKLKGDFAKAEKYYKKALKIDEKIWGKESIITATTYNNLGLFYNLKKDYKKAEEYYKKALKIRENKLGVDAPDTATTYNNIGYLYYCKGDYQRAEEYWRKALKIREKYFGENHPLVKQTLENLNSVRKAMKATSAGFKKTNFDRIKEFETKLVENTKKHLRNSKIKKAVKK